MTLSHFIEEKNHYNWLPKIIEMHRYELFVLSVLGGRNRGRDQDPGPFFVGIEIVLNMRITS